MPDTDNNGNGVTGSCGPEADCRSTIGRIALRLSAARTKGELGSIVAGEIALYSLFDLQIIGGRLNSEIERLPSPYREAIRPYFREQLFGKHHQLLALDRNGTFRRDMSPIRDPDALKKF